MHLSRRVLAVAGTAICLLSAGAVAGAAIASGPVSNGKIYGCYVTKATQSSHALVLQNAGATCPSGDTAIQWNQKGPQGPQGPQGPPGPTNIDSGMVAVTYTGNSLTCAFSEKSGPDNLTVVEISGPQCVISGFPASGVPVITGMNGFANPPVSFNPGTALTVGINYPASGSTANEFSFMITDPSN